MNKILIVIGGLLIFFLWILLADPAHAQGTVVKQGAPGNYGPWPVSLYLPDGGVISFSGGGGGGGSSGNVTVDGGVISTTPQICTTTAQKNTAVGVVSGATPSSQLASRRFIILCNSIQNSGSPLVKCRVDGVAPVMASGNPGDVLAPGDCATYAIAAATIPQCIADTASTNVTSYECL